jgi:hypothetical protein
LGDLMVLTWRMVLTAHAGSHFRAAHAKWAALRKYCVRE